MVKVNFNEMVSYILSIYRTIGSLRFSFLTTWTFTLSLGFLLFVIDPKSNVRRIIPRLRMNFLVCAVCWLLTGGFSTSETHTWFFRCVNLMVCLLLEYITEGCITVRAFPRFSPLWIWWCICSWECMTGEFPTVIALISLLDNVSPLMGWQPQILKEELPTFVTDKRSAHSVNYLIFMESWFVMRTFLYLVYSCCLSDCSGLGVFLHRVLFCMIFLFLEESHGWHQKSWVRRADQMQQNR